MAGLPEITIPPMTCCFGLEDTIEAYVGHMVLVWRELWRVLRGDGVGWLNLGDSYAGNGLPGLRRSGDHKRDCQCSGCAMPNLPKKVQNGLKSKDLMGIPWRVAFALQADGWYLRSDVIWSKKNPMPESIRDRPTKAHEYVFLLAKSERYWWDQEAIREASTNQNGQAANFARSTKEGLCPNQTSVQHRKNRKSTDDNGYRNKRTVWSHIDEIEEHNKLFAFTLARLASDHPELLGNILDEYGSTPDEKSDVWNLATKPYKAAHFAVMPEALVEPCLLAGCPAQVCAGCGEPWVRVIEREKAPLNVYTETSKPKDGFVSVSASGKGMGQKYQNWRNNNPPKTIAHTPTCQCCPLPAAKQATRPGVALDPFFGSGTVGAVAKKFKRTWLGIELNPDYIELARTRLDHTQPALFAR